MRREVLIVGALVIAVGTWAQTFGDGTHLVGQDVAPGTYRASSEGCSWYRLSGFSGDISDVISVGAYESNPIVSILASDVGFKSLNCDTWTAVSLSATPAQTVDPGGIPDGTVGALMLYVIAVGTTLSDIYATNEEWVEYLLGEIYENATIMMNAGGVPDIQALHQAVTELVHSGAEG